MQEDNYPSLKNLKKLLILALLVVGCQSFGVFKHEHEGVCVYAGFENSNILIWSGSSGIPPSNFILSRNFL